MYSAYKLNKQGVCIEPWHTPFPIWNQSLVPCPVLTVSSWPAYRFLKRQVKWSGIPICFRIFHSLLWSAWSKALPYEWSRSRCFSGILWSKGCWQFDLWFLAFSKSSVYMWKFSVHILLKPGVGLGAKSSLTFVTPWTAKLLCPWDSPGKNTGVGHHFLLQGIFPTQELNLGLLHCRQILYWLNYWLEGFWPLPC